MQAPFLVISRKTSISDNLESTEITFNFSDEKLLHNVNEYDNVSKHTSPLQNTSFWSIFIIPAQ